MRTFAPDHVFHNARFVTVDPSFSTAEAIAVYDGKIVAVGDDDEVRSLAGESTQSTDLGGRCALPGQVDGYAHFIYSGVDLTDNAKVNILKLDSIEGIVAAISEKAAKVPAGDWIATSCMHRGAMRERRWPTRFDLDRAAPDHPVYVMQGGRPILANTRALALAGISRDTSDPTAPPGIIVRDDSGEPTGQLIGGAADLARRMWAKSIGESPEHWDFSFFSDEELVDAIAAQQRIFHASGVTTIRDSSTTRREVDALIRSRDSGLLKTRTAMSMMLPESLVAGLAGDPRQLFESFFAPWPLGSDLLWTWGVTMSYTLEGWEFFDRETLRHAIREVARRGWAMAVTPSTGGSPDHVAAVLDEIEALPDPEVARRNGWTLFHPEALRDREEILRCAKLGLSINPNPLLNYHAAARSLRMHQQVAASGLHRDVADDAMAQTASMWGMSTRDWLKAGILTSIGSNSPAVVYDTENPFLGQYCILTGDTTVGPLLPDQRVEREDMVRIATINGARAIRRDSALGSLEVGKLADFIVVDRDLLTCDDKDVASTKVLQTYVGGELVHER